MLHWRAEALLIYSSPVAPSPRSTLTDGIAANLSTFVTKETMPNYFKWVTKEEVDAYQLKQGEFTRGYGALFT